MRSILILAFILCTAPLWAQSGVAVDSGPLEWRATNSGGGISLGFDQKSHGSFLADIEIDDGVLYPSLGYQFYAKYHRLTPFAYYTAGSSGLAFTGFLAHGVDFRLTSRYALRYIREDDWAPAMNPSWTHQNQFLFVINLK